MKTCTLFVILYSFMLCHDGLNSLIDWNKVSYVFIYLFSGFIFNDICLNYFNDFFYKIFVQDGNTSGDENLEEARSRMHKLLDEAFSLISPRNSLTENDIRLVYIFFYFWQCDYGVFVCTSNDTYRSVSWIEYTQFHSDIGQLLIH